MIAFSFVSLFPVAFILHNKLARGISRLTLAKCPHDVAQHLLVLRNIREQKLGVFQHAINKVANVRIHWPIAGLGTILLLLLHRDALWDVVLDE